MGFNQLGDEIQIEDLKKYALQSGYPLESEVSKILSRLMPFKTGYQETLRNYPFETKDELNKPVIRSIDFFVRKQYETTGLKDSSKAIPSRFVQVQFLIDAKFTTSDAWWFIPDEYGIGQTSFYPFLLPYRKNENSSDALDELAYLWGDFINLTETRPQVPWAHSGKKVGFSRKHNEQLNDRDSLSSHQIQLAQAMMSIAEKTLENYNDGAIESTFPLYQDPIIFIPLIVTNAPLFLLKQDVNISTVKKATVAAEFCTKESATYLSHPANASLQSKLHILSKNLRAAEAQGMKLYPSLFTSSSLIVSLDTFEATITHYLDKFDDFFKT